MKLLPTILIILLSSLCLQAQVKHNFEKGPENTNCHELPKNFNNKKEAIELIEASIFRFKQSIKISRYLVPKSVEYYSCDGKTGFMIAKEDDDSTFIYNKVDIDTWQAFIGSSDPITFYRNKIKNDYSTIGDDYTLKKEQNPQN